ncbi:hypothetical protein [Nostoc sp. LPT]|uniref:hypothetical protein n=1 Tax=Nostoc sp. LPT TaxID=2815387 RepID=UPI001D37BE40|nr:hypothetical protein [Nostoc sp. LPT]MBN4005070.1 hypothetical protein [Nostoc sp. LPT]
MAIIVLTPAIAFYIKRSLQPLRQLNQMASVISAEDCRGGCHAGRKGRFRSYVTMP